MILLLDNGVLYMTDFDSTKPRKDGTEKLIDLIKSQPNIKIEPKYELAGDPPQLVPVVAIDNAKVALTDIANLQPSPEAQAVILEALEKAKKLQETITDHAKVADSPPLEDAELREAVLQYIDGVEDADIVADDIMRLFTRYADAARAEQKRLDNFVQASHDNLKGIDDYQKFRKYEAGSPERMAAWIHQLSPWNLGNGVEALRTWRPPTNPKQGIKP